MKKKITLVLLISIYLTFNSFTASNSNEYVVIQNGHYVRTSPNVKKGKLKFKLKKGEFVTVLTKTEKKYRIKKFYDYWYKIKTKSGKTGWTYGSGIAKIQTRKKTMAKLATPVAVKVTHDKHYVRNAPGLYGTKVIFTLNKGQFVRITARTVDKYTFKNYSGYWYKIETKSGKTGWTYSSGLKRIQGKNLAILKDIKPEKKPEVKPEKKPEVKPEKKPEQKIIVPKYKKWFVEKGDPKKSFWREQVKYPYPVSYKKAKDSGGVVWEVAYMDVKPIKGWNGKTIVFIHGKGVFGAYWSKIMKYALEKGFRVIAPDLPNCGKSIPGNLKNPVDRSLKQAREVIYDIIVKQLGVKKAVYVGHSMGGHFILGYTLRYPKAVEKIMLTASAGIETFKVPIFGKRLAKFENLIKNDIYRKLYMDDVNMKPEIIRLFFYFKKKNKKGKVVPYNIGFFHVKNSMSELITQIRIKMIPGNKEEFKRYTQSSIRDVYSMGREVYRWGGPRIYKNYSKIKSPILLTYGSRECFIPTRLNPDLRKIGTIKSVMIPFIKMMAKAGNKPIAKLYKGAAHFPHNDNEEEFAKDLIEFITTGKLKSAYTRKMLEQASKKEIIWRKKMGLDGP